MFGIANRMKQSAQAQRDAQRVRNAEFIGALAAGPAAARAVRQAMAEAGAPVVHPSVRLLSPAAAKKAWGEAQARLRSEQRSASALAAARRAGVGY